MDQRTAIRLIVSHLEDGWAQAAQICGRAEGPMREAWGAAATRHVPSAIDAQIISEYAIAKKTPHCYAWIEAVAMNAGGEFKPHEAPEGSAHRLQDDTSKLLAECADVVREVMARTGQPLCANDRKRLRKELMEMAEAMRRVDEDIDADEHASHVRAVK